jgi:dTDP-4-dehydrorhamnose reductase
MLARDLVPVLSRAHEVFALDHSSCDITRPSDIQRVVAECRPQIIVNCAAFPDVDGCERDPERAFAVNGAGPGNLARAAEAAGARVFHISTDYVFDGAKGAPYIESDATNPISAYGRSKLEGERQVLGTETAGSPHLVIRTSWLYGIHKVNFVDRTLEAAQARPQVEAVADQISSMTWTVHLAQRIAELAETAATGIIHLAGSGQCSRLEAAQAIICSMPAAVPVIPITWAKLNLPATRPAFSAITSRRWQELGLQPLPHWKDALHEYLRLRQEHQTERAGDVRSTR